MSPARLPSTLPNPHGSDGLASAAKIIDLRGELSVSPSEPEPEQVNDSPPSADAERQLRKRRRMIIGLLAAAALLIVCDLVLGRVVHDQRQRHLAYDVTQAKAKIDPGDALMVLQIPQIGVNTVVTEGATSSDLRAGPGHVIGTSLPNSSGNIVVLGNRTRYGGPFRDLSSVTTGSQIAVRTRSGQVRSYSVAENRTVPDSDRSAIARSDVEKLTLVTRGSGIRPDQLVVVTATPDAALVGNAGPGAFRPSAGALDARPSIPWLGGPVLLVLLILMGVAFVVGGRELRRRYSPLAAFGVLLPVIGLLVVVFIFAVDSVAPFMY